MKLMRIQNFDQKIMNRRAFIAAIGLLLSAGAASALPRPDWPFKRKSAKWQKK